MKSRKPGIGEILMGVLMYAYYERKIWLGVALAVGVSLLGYCAVNSFMFVLGLIDKAVWGR